MSVKNCENCGRFFNDQDKYCSPECAREVVGAFDRKRLESGSAEPEDEPVPMTWGSCAFGCAYLCFRVIVYLIIIIAVGVGLAMLLDAFNQMD